MLWPSTSGESGKVRIDARERGLYDTSVFNILRKIGDSILKRTESPLRGKMKEVRASSPAHEQQTKHPVIKNRTMLYEKKKSKKKKTERGMRLRRKGQRAKFFPPHLTKKERGLIRKKR